MVVNFDDVVRIGTQLPEVEVGTSYRTPALKVGGKSFCRLWGKAENERKGPVEGEVLVAFCEIEAKESLVESHDALFDQEHYHGYGALLVRLDDADDELLEDVLEDAYRTVAPARLVRLLDRDG